MGCGFSYYDDYRPRFKRKFKGIDYIMKNNKNSWKMYRVSTLTHIVNQNLYASFSYDNMYMIIGRSGIFFNIDENTKMKTNNNWMYRPWSSVNRYGYDYNISQIKMEVIRKRTFNGVIHYMPEFFYITFKRIFHPVQKWFTYYYNRAWRIIEYERNRQARVKIKNEYLQQKIFQQKLSEQSMKYDGNKSIQNMNINNTENNETLSQPTQNTNSTVNIKLEDIPEEYNTENNTK
jgi:hypothetical protein